MTNYWLVFCDVLESYPGFPGGDCKKIGTKQASLTQKVGIQQEQNWNYPIYIFYSELQLKHDIQAAFTAEP